MKIKLIEPTSNNFKYRFENNTLVLCRKNIISKIYKYAISKYAISKYAISKIYKYAKVVLANFECNLNDLGLPEMAPIR